MRVLAVSLCALLYLHLSPGDAFSADMVSTVDLPYAVDLDVDHHLFVYGEELTGRLTFAFDDAKLTVNDIVIEPRPGTGRKRLTDDRLTVLYGAVPFVRSRVASGVPIRAAVDSLQQRERDMTARIGETWRVLRDELLANSDNLTPDEAATAYERIADSALTYLDLDILGEGARVAISPHGTLTYTIEGQGGLVEAPLGQPPITPSPPPPLTEERAAMLVARLLPYFSCEAPGLAILSRGADVLECASDAQATLAEIRALQANPDAPVQRIPSATVTDIRSRRGR